MEFNAKLQRLRAGQNMTQEELAEKRSFADKKQMIRMVSPM
ncbi:MAG TPA: hypothetical protein PLT89_03630 [Syntrophomonadaceae bacterium]|jgi:transcriptional regulator with XRE-family HTH domain|nr:hypothetical protein [Syntrophomonadaceae bacterium]